MIRSLAIAAIALAVATSGTLSLGPRAGAQQPTVLTIHQDVPALASVDIGGTGTSHGDMLAFEAGITTDDGMAGTLSGILITIDLPGDAGDVFEDRVGQLVFALSATDTIVVAGESVYAGAATEMTPDQPQLRAVIGGTGRFIGARGQVATTRNEDGTYEHVFELID